MNLDPYLALRPERHSLRSLPSLALSELRRFFYLLAHTVWPYKRRPTPPQGLKQQSPSGTFSPEHLSMCVRRAAQSADRLAVLESKAGTLLSLISVLAPLSASAAVFVALNSPSMATSRFVLVVQCAAFLLLLLASVAVLRALAIREHEEIGVGGFIDQGAVRPYSPDFEARGLLYVAAVRDAVSDHVADFVRAAQVFLWIAIAAQVIAGGFALPLVRDKPQAVEGTVSLAPATTQALAELVGEGHLARRVDSLSVELSRTQRALDQLNAAEIESGRSTKKPPPRSRR